MVGAWVLTVQFCKLSFLFDYLYNKNIYKSKMKLQLDSRGTNVLAGSVVL